MLERDTDKYLKIFYFIILVSVCHYWGCVESYYDEVNEKNTSNSSVDSNGELVDTSSSKKENSKIVLSKSIDAEDTVVHLDFVSQDGDNVVTPRVAEIYLSYTENLSYSMFYPGDAVQKSEKQLVVQNLNDRNRIRLIVFAGDNINELKGGRIATFRFRKDKTDEKGIVRILTESPIFAPIEANEGLLIGNPLIF